VWVGVDSSNAFFVGWWEWGSAKETPEKATKTTRIAADWTFALRQQKARRRFLAIMVAIFGGFKSRFSGSRNLTSYVFV
jgi:hypothetical protein